MSKFFCVSLKEYFGDKFIVKFFCCVSSDDDVFDQVEDIYFDVEMFIVELVSEDEFEMVIIVQFL